jgi:large subunit ribosomal protein L23
MSRLGQQLNTKIILERPHLTEKASLLAANSRAYAFRVGKSATKAEVARTVAEIYKVKPWRVNMVTVKSKTMMLRGRPGKRAGFKKAYVYLRPGEKIDLV